MCMQTYRIFMRGNEAARRRKRKKKKSQQLAPVNKTDASHWPVSMLKMPVVLLVLLAAGGGLKSNISCTSG